MQKRTERKKEKVSVCVTETECGEKIKKRLRAEDRKVHLIEERIYKRRDLAEFELCDSVEGPHTLHLTLSFHPIYVFFYFSFFSKRKEHFGNLLTLSSGQKVKRSLNIQ